MIREYYKLKLKESILKRNLRTLITKALKVNDRRVTFEKMDEEDDYPLTMLLSGRRDIYFISVTDVYLDEHENIYVDGIDDDTSYKRKEFKIEEDQYSDILYFIGYTLGWSDSRIEQSVISETNSTIMEMSCQLAEKEMVNTCGKLPEDFMKKNGEYKVYYQAMFNPLYDKNYARIAELADFELNPA